MEIELTSLAAGFLFDIVWLVRTTTQLPFFFSSFFRALPEKTTNKMKTFNPEKVSSILKIVSSNLKYKNNEERAKLYHHLQSVHYFIFF